MKEEMTYTSSNEDLKKVHNDHILKRIPAGAEATVVLVGAVDFLDQPTIAFVRLAEGAFMPSITEVTIPVRFMFTLLGPRTADLDYHEIGRSISTLMSNASFHKVAYKATERRELLSAINEFLDDSIVLPPGDWERQALLPFDELKSKSEAIKRRKAKALAGATKPIQSDAAVKKGKTFALFFLPRGLPFFEAFNNFSFNFEVSLDFSQFYFIMACKMTIFMVKMAKSWFFCIKTRRRPLIRMM